MADVLASYDQNTLKSLEETLPVEIDNIERNLADVQVILQRKRKLQSDVKSEMEARTVADAQRKTKERIAGKPVKTRLRMLAALLRCYVRERYGAFYGDKLQLHVTYNDDAIHVSFGSYAETAVRVMQDGTLCITRNIRKVHNATPINVLNDHPRTWGF